MGAFVVQCRLTVVGGRCLLFLVRRVCCVCCMFVCWLRVVWVFCGFCQLVLARVALSWRFHALVAPRCFVGFRDFLVLGVVRLCRGCVRGSVPPNCRWRSFFVVSGSSCLLRVLHVCLLVARSLGVLWVMPVCSTASWRFHALVAPRCFVGFRDFLVPIAG